ncbi:MAG: DUF4401 domain-containing protein [Campylobacterales bacterium]|nr:DUF4401 domain-containing protein [Campylobacterales bacterium]
MKIEDLEVGKVLSWIGMFFIGSGVVFFFAYNWNELHKFEKLGVTISFIFVAIGIYLFSKKDSILNDTSLWLATVGIGVTLAVFGQIYQTGADAYNLFVAWSIFAFGLVGVSKSSINWFTFLILINLTLRLYLEQALHMDEQGITSIMIVGNSFIALLLFFAVKKENLSQFKWLLEAVILYLLLLNFNLLMGEFFQPFSRYSLFFVFYVALLYYIKKKGQLLGESLAILTLVFLLPTLLSSLVGGGLNRFYLGVPLFVIFSLVGLKYMVGRIKETEISFNKIKLPWITHVFIFITVTFAASGILVIGFMTNIINNDRLIPLGILTLVTALVLKKKQTLSLNWYYGLFTAIILAEFAIVVGTIINYDYDVSVLGISLPMFVLIGIQIVLFVFMKDYLYRVRSIIVFNVAILHTSGSVSYELAVVLLLTITGLILVANHYKKQLSDIYISVNDGLIVSSFVIGYIFLSHENLMDSYMILYQVVGSLLLFYSFIKVQENQNKFIVALMAIGVSFIPSLSIFLILFFLSYKNEKKYLVLFSLISIILSMGVWYYQLNITLLNKSLYLIGAGVMVLLMSYFMGRKEKSWEG